MRAVRRVVPERALLAREVLDSVTLVEVTAAVFDGGRSARPVHLEITRRDSPCGRARSGRRPRRTGDLRRTPRRRCDGERSGGRYPEMTLGVSIAADDLAPHGVPHDRRELLAAIRSTKIGHRFIDRESKSGHIVFSMHDEHIEELEGVDSTERTADVTTGIRWCVVSVGGQMGRHPMGTGGRLRARGGGRGVLSEPGPGRDPDSRRLTVCAQSARDAVPRMECRRNVRMGGKRGHARPQFPELGEGAGRGCRVSVSARVPMFGKRSRAERVSCA